MLVTKDCSNPDRNQDVTGSLLPRFPEPRKPGPDPADPASLWDRVAVGDPQHCWPWLGARTAKGYGRITIGGKEWRAHRLAYTLTKGEVPPDKVVRHTCDNPPCCNPAHLELGTVLDNNHDAIKRGRKVVFRGMRNANAKLSDDDVRRIRADSRRQTVIARDYRIAPSTVSEIKSGKRRAEA